MPLGVDSLVEQRRASLLQAALELFVEKGYHQTKVSDVVKRAGVSQGTFYYYFPGKRAAFDALMDAWFEPFWHLFDDGWVDPTTTTAVLEQVARRRWASLLHLYADRPLLARFILKHAEGVSPDVTVRMEEFREWVASILERAGRRRQEAGMFRPINTRVLAHAMIGAIERLAVRWFVIGETPSISPEELAGEFVDILSPAHFRTALEGEAPLDHSSENAPPIGLHSS